MPALQIVDIETERDSMAESLEDALAPELLAHRDHMLAKHFEVPLTL